MGLLCFYIIYYRLKAELTPDRIPLIRTTFTNPTAVLWFVSTILLMPLNWGIEALKWQHITRRVETITFLRANQSVYAGVFAGNLAPGRATEFLAKILFFNTENRPAISVLHFLNGMFQLSITIVLGLAAFVCKAQDFNGEWQWIKYTGLVGGLILMLVFIWCMLNTEYLIQLVYRRLLKQQMVQMPAYSFSGKSIRFLLGFSILRYMVFTLQFAFLLRMAGVPLEWDIFVSIAIYFFITTTIPMISFLEAAIRVAVALVVFKTSPIEPVYLTIISVLLWLINIVLPSIAGYIILLREKMDLSFLKRKTSAS